MEEEFEEPDFGHFILIKDSLSAEAEILEFSDDHYELIEKLESLIKEENEIRLKENDRPNSLMERKHSDFRYYWPMLKAVESEKEKEIIRYTDGRLNYRIEEL